MLPQLWLRRCKFGSMLCDFFTSKLQKMWKICTSGLLEPSECTKYNLRFAPRTPLGKLTPLPRTPSWDGEGDIPSTYSSPSTPSASWSCHPNVFLVPARLLLKPEINVKTVFSEMAIFSCCVYFVDDGWYFHGWLASGEKVLCGVVQQLWCSLSHGCDVGHADCVAVVHAFVASHSSL